MPKGHCLQGFPSLLCVRTAAGVRYTHLDPPSECPFLSVGCVFNHQHVYANKQARAELTPLPTLLALVWFCQVSDCALVPWWSAHHTPCLVGASCSRITLQWWNTQWGCFTCPYPLHPVPSSSTATCAHHAALDLVLAALPLQAQALCTHPFLSLYLL